MKPDRLVVQLIIVAAMSMSICALSQSLVFADRPCEGDVAFFCQGAEGPKQVLGCLRQNFEQLSPQCKVHIVQVAEAVKEAHQDCEADIYVLCPGVQPGGGRVIQCLKQNRDYLSPECKTGILDLLMSTR
jgi:hypothetical protein